jgi:hypothetical protein
MAFQECAPTLAQAPPRVKQVRTYRFSRASLARRARPDGESYQRANRGITLRATTSIPAVWATQQVMTESQRWLDRSFLALMRVWYNPFPIT